MQIYFYHLTTQKIEVALPKILMKVRELDERALVIVGNEQNAKNIDEALWAFDPTSFLPHGVACGAKEDEAQPILITQSDINSNSASYCFLLDGVDMPQNAANFSRLNIVFSEYESDVLDIARKQWKEAKASGAELAYFQQTPEGSWHKKA